MKQTKRDRAGLGQSIQGAAPWKSALAAGNEPFSRKWHSGHFQVDANHDGVMDNRDLTSLDAPFQFWVNDNYDRNVYDNDDSAFYDDEVASNNPAADSPGTPGVPTPDYKYLAGDGKTACIPNDRDLQDYARLWIPGLSNMVANLPTNYTVTLQWRNNVGAAIHLFKASETNGGTNYLFNESEAGLQTLFDSYPCYGNVSPSQTISLDQAFASTTVPKPSDYFIFCGAAQGNDELVCQVRNPYGGVVGEASVFLNLKNIKQMYERWSVGEYPNLPSNVATNAGDDGSPSFQYPYDSTVDSATPYILFVHGWNMETWEKDRFAESAFKRLYWQGYQGRFGSFRWPTENGFTGTLIQFATTPSEKDNYDRSEYVAWQSAAGLLNQLLFLNGRYPGQTYMLAHSMGNIVAGEALRLARTTNVVNTYVASQAAISAHTYDTNVPNYSFSYSPWTSFAQTPNIYGNWFATNNGNGAGQIISFYNANDYALQRSVWQLNQMLKPDQFVLEGSTHWDYSYNGLTNSPPPWNYFEKAVSLGFTVIDFDIVNVLTNRYEVMGLAAESYTTALGATPGVQNVRRNVDLSQIWPSDSVHPTHPFDEHFYHSAQFRGDYWQQQGYWSELLGSDAFNLKQP